MELEELRVGNKTYFDFHKDSGGRKEITIFTLDLVNIERGKIKKHYSPIPLTEEWLIKFGFEKKENSIINFFNKIVSESKSPIDENSILFTEVSLSLCNDKGQGEYYFFIKQGNRDNEKDASVVGSTARMFYVHQLQNLYHALTSQELVINE